MVKVKRVKSVKEMKRNGKREKIELKKVRRERIVGDMWIMKIDFILMIIMDQGMIDNVGIEVLIRVLLIKKEDETKKIEDIEKQGKEVEIGEIEIQGVKGGRGIEEVLEMIDIEKVKGKNVVEIGEISIEIKVGKDMIIVRIKTEVEVEINMIIIRIKTEIEIKIDTGIAKKERMIEVNTENIEIGKKVIIEKT